MSRRQAREIVFVCSGISNTGELISQVIPGKTPAEASALFLEQNQTGAPVVHGPFYKKKTQISKLKILNLLQNMVRIILLVIVIII